MLKVFSGCAAAGFLPSEVLGLKESRILKDEPGIVIIQKITDVWYMLKLQTG